MLALTQPTGIARGRGRPCRYLTVRGLPCQQHPLIGQDFCYQHGKHRHPVCPSGPNVVIPLIENPETIQLIATQVAQGLFAETLDPWRAGKILYALQVAAMTFSRPARLQPVKAEPVEPVTEVFESPDGELLGPAEFTPASRARFDSVWSFDKFRYEQECERLGQPKPETPADMPQSGWLNPDDLDNVTEQANRGEILPDDGYKEKMLELRLDADRRGALPPLAERKCSYGDGSWCRGPAAQGKWQSACGRCTRERDEYCRLHPDQPKPTCYSDEPTGLQAVASPAEPEPLLSRPGAPQPGLSEPKASRMALPGFGRCGRARTLSRTDGAQRRRSGRRGDHCTPVVEAVNIAKLGPCNTKSCLAVMGGTPRATTDSRSSSAPAGAMPRRESKDEEGEIEELTSPNANDNQANAGDQRDGAEDGGDGDGARLFVRNLNGTHVHILFAVGVADSPHGEAE
jgi:hypothetical protein